MAAILSLYWEGGSALKPNMIIKMCIDLAMTILLLCLMAYLLVGESAHEWIGVAMFFLLIAHHALNWKWYRNLVRGRYTALRTVQTVLNFLILITMLSSMVSGIMMSHEVFAFLSISGGMRFARILHMLAAYWGFILMSLHLGLHWRMIMGLAKKTTNTKTASNVRTWPLRLMAVLISAYGLYAFLKNNIASYLYLKNQFVYFDMEQPLLQFFAEYLVMMGLWVCLAYYGSKLLQKKTGRKKSESADLNIL